MSKHKGAEQLDLKFNLKAKQINADLLDYLLVLAPNHALIHHLLYIMDVICRSGSDPVRTLSRC